MTVTCQTEGCELYGVAIDCSGMPASYFAAVLCGSCGQPPSVDGQPPRDPEQV
jgi:hypothetical protein